VWREGSINAYRTQEYFGVEMAAVRHRHAALVKAALA
jgi:hypothetical protein